MNLKDNELLVIGSSGLSAKYFFERLAKENYKKKIKCLLRSHSQTDHLKSFDLDLEFIYIDFNDIDALKTSMLGVKTILNIVGMKLSKKIIQAGTEIGVNWFICVHTTGRYSKFESKSAKYIEKEDALLKEFSNLTILRPTMIYGNNKDKNMHKLVRYIHKNKFIPVFGNGKNLMSPIHAQDLGYAYYDVLHNRNTTFGKQYNLSGKYDITYISILEETASALSKKIFFIHLPIWLCLIAVYLINLIFRSRFPILFEQILGMKEDKVFSWDDAYSDFGFSPISFNDGIRLQVDEFIK